jgi:hypothetical protein
VGPHVRVERMRSCSTAQVVRSRRGILPTAGARGQYRSILALVPLPVAILLLSFLLPGEFDFGVGTLRLNCRRLILIGYVPLALMQLVSQRRLRSFDYLFVGAFVYYVLAVFIKEQFDKAAVTGGIIFLESAGSYLIARAYIKNEAQFAAMVKLLFALVVIMGFVAIPEALFGAHLTKNVAAEIAGSPSWPSTEWRYGLLRAMAMFDHPIHYGAFCAGVFGLAWYANDNVRERIIRATVIAMATFVSLSAGPLQGILVILAGACWERCTRHISRRVWWSIAFLVIGYFALFLIANRSPFMILLTNTVLDPGSVWYRLFIWHYGLETISNNPWLGAPMGIWERPAWMSDTLDCYWLAIAIWGGLPSLSLQVISLITLLRAVNCTPQVPEGLARRRCRYAWSATVLALCWVGLTVHYFGALGVFFSFCVGCGGWLAEGTYGRTSALRKETSRRQPVRTRPVELINNTKVDVEALGH